jgi:23S rRNA (guanosine2251-2'-O)-methyltransferase
MMQKDVVYMATIITGKNTVYEAIQAKRKIFEIYVLKGTAFGVVTAAKKHGIKVIELDKQGVKDVLPPHSQGVGAKVEDYKLLSIEDAISKPKENKLFVMLDSLEDPHNLGAILRSSDAFGVDGIILPKNRSVQLNNTVAKVSTGAIEYVDVIGVTNLTQTIKKLKDNGFWIVGTDAATEQTIHDINVDTDICLVIGSEGKGISRLVRENCDYTVKIPMVGHVNSLNASVSAALTIYEIVRRRGN